MEVYCLAALCFEVRLEALDLLADDFLHAGLGDMTYMTYNPKDDDAREVACILNSIIQHYL